MQSKTKMWENALRLEKEYWLSSEFIERLPKRMKKRKEEADKFRKVYEKVSSVSFEESKILQIGSAAIGLINDLDKDLLYAVDPLKSFYEENFKMYLNPKVNYLEGVGEKLPFENNKFDWVICTKTLMHVSSPEKVLEEIHRVLKMDGKAYITLSIYEPVSCFFINRGKHLRFLSIKDFNCYTVKSFSKFVESNGFKIINNKYKSFNQKRMENREKKKKLSSLVFTEVNLEVVIEKVRDI